MRSWTILADDSELDYIRTFLAQACTGTTVKHQAEAGSIYDEQAYTTATSRIFIFPPELMGSFSTRKVERYQLQLKESTEALLTTMYNHIQSACQTANRWGSVGTWTRPSTFCNIHVANGNKAFMKESFSRIIFIDVEWSIE